MSYDLSQHLCDFKAEHGDICDECRLPINAGGSMYFFSDGPPEPRDGTYRCKACAITFANEVDGGIR
jgi:hypothetical protein